VVGHLYQGLKPLATIARTPGENKM